MKRGNTGLILVGHPGLAEALVDIMCSIVGEAKTTILVHSIPNDSDTVLAIEGINQAIANKSSTEQWLILCDIMGATPWNVALQVQQHHQAPVITGLNLPMLLRANNYSDQHDALSLGEMVCEGGAASILLHPCHDPSQAQ